MDVFWQSLFGFLEKLGPIVVPLIGAYIGWRLGQKGYVRQLLVDNIKNKFDALRQVKSVIENIPPDLSDEVLVSRLDQNNEFCTSLTSRLVRLFGLRNELIPFLPQEFVELVEDRLQPLYSIENGTYTYRTGKHTELGVFAREARSLVSSIETRLIAEYNEQLK